MTAVGWLMVGSSGRRESMPLNNAVPKALA